MNSRPVSRSANETPVLDSGRLSYQNPTPKIKIIKTDTQPSGESVQLVRPMPTINETSTADIVNKLVSNYDYKKVPVRGDLNDLNTMKTAFPNLAGKLLETYDGSVIVTDTNQELVGDKYITEQIKRINEDNKKRSILDKWSHLLYEGEKDYKSAKEVVPELDLTNYRPTQSRTFSINSTRGGLH